MGRGTTHLEEQILHYMELHPHAADTAEGIATWWLKHNRVKLSQVQAAVENLVKRNLAIRRKSPDGHILYSKGILQPDHIVKHGTH